MCMAVCLSGIILKLYCFLATSFALVFFVRTLFEIFIIVLVCRILVFMHMPVSFLCDGAVQVIVFSADIYRRSGGIVVFMDMSVVKRGFPAHVMDVAGFVRVAACHSLIIMPVPVIDRRFAQIVM